LYSKDNKIQKKKERIKNKKRKNTRLIVSSVFVDVGRLFNAASYLNEPTNSHPHPPR
jgi:hypothetical protein